MVNESVTLQGTVLADGSLKLTTPVSLEPGPVEVTIRPARSPGQGETAVAVLRRIHAEQDAAGYVPRTAEEINASIREMHDEWDERQQAIEALQEACRRARDGSSPSEATS
jgi:hypothetical protein